MSFFFKKEFSCAFKKNPSDKLNYLPIFSICIEEIDITRGLILGNWPRRIPTWLPSSLSWVYYSGPVLFGVSVATRPPWYSLNDDGGIDFGDQGAVRALTMAMLRVDFDLHITLPEDRLCPTVANRLDYIHLIEDLLSHSGIDYEREQIKGLDMYVRACRLLITMTGLSLLL